jgi:Lrp/AsnC family transcriptional regulator, leucine-responsive regulatory protein
MQAFMTLDHFDKKILAELQKDGRLKNNELADRIALSASPCLRRVNALEESGVIEGYVALVKPELVGFGLSVFVNVRLSSQTHEATTRFETVIKTCKNVMECHFMAGSTDYILRVCAKNIQEYEMFLMSTLTKIDVVSKVESFISMRNVMRSTVLPIE